MRRLAAVLAAAALAVPLAACSSGGSPRGATSPGSTTGPASPTGPASASVGTPPAGQVVVRFAGAPPLAVEVADSPDERRVGLMNRTSLAPGTGMLFLYPRRVSSAFWMKNTLIPLSIAFVDGDTVVSTAEMVPCRADPCPTYPPEGDYTFAVEAAAGFFPDHGVKAGTKVTVDGTLGQAT